MMYKTEDTKTWMMPRQSESTQISGSLVSCLRSQYLRRPIDWRALLTQLSPQIKVVMIYVPLATIWEHSAAQCTLLKTPALAWKRSKIHTGVSKEEHPESQGNWTLDSCLKVNVLARQRTCRRVIAERQTNVTSALTPPGNLQPQFAECARLCVTAGGRRRSRSDAGGSTPAQKGLQIMHITAGNPEPRCGRPLRTWAKRESVIILVKHRGARERLMKCCRGVSQ